MHKETPANLLLEPLNPEFNIQNSTIQRDAFIQDINTEQISEGLSEGLNEGLRTLFITIQKNPGVQAKDLPDLLNSRPLKTIERQLSQLIRQNYIKRDGSRKTGGYIALKTQEG